jgi:hypothetical protein
LRDTPLSGSVERVIRKAQTEFKLACQSWSADYRSLKSASLCANISVRVRATPPVKRIWSVMDSEYGHRVGSRGSSSAQW